jgi:hypothetical protein
VSLGEKQRRFQVLFVVCFDIDYSMALFGLSSGTNYSFGYWFLFVSCNLEPANSSALYITSSASQSCV